MLLSTESEVRMEPRDYAERIEREPTLPGGTMERFGGYGVMGLPFVSGHVLGLRRFTASSIGPGYTSVWHRDPNGEWTFYADVTPMQACTRFFGNEVARAVECPIEISWPEPRRLSVRVEQAEMTWECELTPTPVTRMMNLMAGAMPDGLWRNSAVLGVMASMAGPALRAGKLGMTGVSPNRQRFIANPMVMWTIPRAVARLGDVSFGPVGPLREQARLGDFWIPQRGMCVVGRAFFESFDPSRHLAVVSRAASPPE